LIERLVLRPLVNRSQITLFMATLGLSFVIEGLAQGLMGAGARAGLGIEDVPLFIGRLMLSQFDLIAAAAAVVLVTVLALLFNKTRIGVSLRAVADDTTAASASTSTASGRSSGRWPGWSGWWPGCCGARAGRAVLAVAGGAQGLPVLIIGGFTSIGGAIVGG
jgi:branched-chain amino acid transport system permease protein